MNNIAQYIMVNNALLQVILKAIIGDERANKTIKDIEKLVEEAFKKEEK